MGAWGFGPYDNDRASDMIILLTRPIDRALKGSVRAGRHHYEEARAAAMLTVNSHATDILGGPGLLKSVRVLAMMRSDEEWLSTWKSPSKVANALDHEMEHVFLRMLQCRGCKNERFAANRLILAAKAVKVPRKRALVSFTVRRVGGRWVRTPSRRPKWSADRHKRSKLHRRKPKR